MNKIIISLTLISLSCACNKDEIVTPPEIEIQPFVADFDAGNGIMPDDFPADFGTEPSVGAYPDLINSIQFVSDTVRNGNYAMKITVRPEFQTQEPGRPVKNRTEVNYKHNNVENSEVWYQWSFLIPQILLNWIQTCILTPGMLLASSTPLPTRNMACLLPPAPILLLPYILAENLPAGRLG